MRPRHQARRVRALWRLLTHGVRALACTRADRLQIVAHDTSLKRSFDALGGRVEVERAGFRHPVTRDVAAPAHRVGDAPVPEFDHVVHGRRLLLRRDPAANMAAAAPPQATGSAAPRSSWGRQATIHRAHSSGVIPRSNSAARTSPNDGYGDNHGAYGSGLTRTGGDRAGPPFRWAAADESHGPRYWLPRVN